jgi:N-acetylglutamate synthase-like GNAT family acetyltransferase
MIRQFRSRDAQSCFDVIRGCILQDIHTPTGTLEKLLHAESAESIAGRARLYYLVVYELEDDIVGVAGLDMNEIRLLFVAPDHQGEGIGRALLDHLEAMVPSTMFKEIFVYSTLSGETFYRHCGYQCRGEHVFYLDGQPLPTRFMVKTLPAP